MYQLNRNGIRTIAVVADYKGEDSKTQSVDNYEGRVNLQLRDALQSLSDGTLESVATITQHECNLGRVHELCLYVGYPKSSSRARYNDLLIVLATEKCDYHGLARGFAIALEQANLLPHQWESFSGQVHERLITQLHDKLMNNDWYIPASILQVMPNAYEVIKSRIKSNYGFQETMPDAGA